MRAGAACTTRCTAPTRSPRMAAQRAVPATTAIRGARVIAKARQVLDQAVPLAIGSHRDATRYAIDDGRLMITLKDHARTGLARPEQFVGYRGAADDPASVLLKHNGLHIEIVVDRTRPIGGQDAAGVADVVLEAAITTIQDCEDSVACVDADGQGGGISQLARPDARHADRDVRQGRPHGHAPADRRSRIHRAGWRHADSAGPQPDAGAQRRPPHVHRCGARCVGQRRRPRACWTPRSPR